MAIEFTRQDVERILNVGLERSGKLITMWKRAGIIRAIATAKASQYTKYVFTEAKGSESVLDDFEKDREAAKNKYGEEPFTTKQLAQDILGGEQHLR
ncbi:MAG TPA: hypothetical protein DCE56_43430 [Cyanobacteria bacterium UBA8553]|nr:hypothetical protein [Cyanobacteria bacterium UBA8553]